LSPHEPPATRPHFEAEAKPETPTQAHVLESVPTNVDASAKHTEIGAVSPTVSRILNSGAAPIRNAPPKFGFKPDEAPIAKVVQPDQGQRDVRRISPARAAMTEQLQSPAATPVRSSFDETAPASPARKSGAAEAPRISDTPSLRQEPSRRNDTVLPRPIRQNEAIASPSYPECRGKATGNSLPHVRIGVVEVRAAPQTTPARISPVMSSATAGPARESTVLSRGFPSFGLSQS
jgi:hypothetical protein